MATTTSPVLIVGGGVGGTATAVALTRKGIDVRVFEKARDLSRIHVGGCYVLWYAGVLALAHLGLADKAHALGHPVERFEMGDRSGRLYYSLHVGDRGRELGAVPLAIRRADLLSLLTDSLDKDSLHLGATFRDAVQDETGVTATFTDGHQERGAVLVGADGLDSTVRAHLHGREPPRYPGYAHWSGIADDDGTTTGGAFRVLHGHGARFAFFHLGNGKVCWWCVRNAPEGPEGDAAGSLEALTTFFGTWDGAGALLAATPPETIHRRDTLDRPPLKRWGDGRITLLGDAAHAMTFNLGQGAGTSLTDAVSLAHHLSKAPTQRSLRTFERQRRRVTTPLLRMSARVGAAAAWDWPLGPKANEAFVRIGERFTPGILERDLRHHPGLGGEHAR